MTQPQTLNSDQLKSYGDRINAGGLDAAKQVYTELYALGYKYAGWAQGVATGQTLTGVSALDYLTGTALMGLGNSQTCRDLSDAQIDKIRVDMAKGYVEALQKIATNNHNVLDRDVDYRETKEFHEEGFTANGLNLDNWTLNTPMELMRQAQGDAAVEALWTKLRDTGGEGRYATWESFKLLSMVKDAADAGNEQASAWAEQVPGGLGISDLGSLGRALDTFKKWFGNNLSSDDPFGITQSMDTVIPRALFFANTLEVLLRSVNLDSWTTDFGGAESTTSPLVLDLNGDGVQTTRLSNSFTQGVHFNLDATGLAENTAWVDAQDGLLVRDLNADGQISSGRELFGNHTLLHNGARAANGFEALAELDDNADGVVDANDALFASLKVWKDANSDGVTDAGELLTLAQNNFVREFTPITVSDAAKALPGLQGSGWVRDLQEAATFSPGLITLVNQAKDAPTRTDYKNAVVGLLHKRENNHDYKKRFNYRARNKNKIKNIFETVFLEAVT